MSVQSQALGITVVSHYSRISRKGAIRPQRCPRNRMALTSLSKYLTTISEGEDITSRKYTSSLEFFHSMRSSKGYYADHQVSLMLPCNVANRLS